MLSNTFNVLFPHEASNFRTKFKQKRQTGCRPTWKATAEMLDSSGFCWNRRRCKKSWVSEWKCDLSCVHVVSEESEKKVSPVGNIYMMPPNVGTTARKVGENDGTWVDAETWWTETFIQVMYWISKYGSWVMCNLVIEVVTVSRCPRRATCISLKHIPTSQLDARERTIGGKTSQLGKWDHSGSAWMQHKSGSEWIHKWVCVFVIEQICARATEPIIEQVIEEGVSERIV